MLPETKLCVAARFASPRLRGEAGTHRRCVPGEGESPRIRLSDACVETAPHPNPLPARAGRGSAFPLRRDFSPTAR
ncbi:hypothetical protein XH93_17735 [Bradyrhizobium sp. CCBAU 51753]|nr:hypothetical protein XH93_17735 [Bradyrhizobium sp. CCBAU 51753]